MQTDKTYKIKNYPDYFYETKIGRFQNEQINHKENKKRAKKSENC